MFVEAIEAILDDLCTPGVVRAIERGSSPTPLWNAISESGFLDLLTPEGEGGAGLKLDELFPVIECLGRYAVPVPVAQSIFARAVLLLNGVAVPEGMITFASTYQSAGNHFMQCALTPYGLIADAVLADHGGDLVMLSCAQASRESSGVHGSQSATLRWDKGIEPDARVVGCARVLHACGAVIHAALLAGAMSRVFAMTLQYANDRSQFGKPIGKFQAIQQQLAVMAEQVASARVAAEIGFDTAEAVPDFLRAGIAKARTSEAVTSIAATAHAVHGAIGVTEEYDLQLFNRRMHEWRITHGSEQYWNSVIGRALLESGGAASDFVREVA